MLSLWRHAKKAEACHDQQRNDTEKVDGYNNGECAGAFHFLLYIPIEHADDVNKLISSSCELSSPPKTSSKWIHNSTNSAVHDEALTMC